jgi:ribonuclease HI
MNIPQGNIKGKNMVLPPPSKASDLVVFLNSCCGPRSSGLMGWGMVMGCFGRGPGEEVWGIGGQGAAMSHHAADYLALCEALKHLWARAYTRRRVWLYTGSRLVAAQMKGDATCSGGLYLPFYREAVRLAAPFRAVMYMPEHAPDHRRAYALARKALAAVHSGQ